MHRYAIWGTATSPAHEAWVRSIGDAFEADGFARVDDIADADFVLNMFDAEQPKAFRRQSPRDVLGVVLRARRGSRRRPQDELPDARPHAGERRRSPRARPRRLVHDDGARDVQDLGRAAGGLRAARAAGEVEARDRQRVHPRPRARPLGRRRGHRGHRLGGQADAGPRPASRAVPGRTSTSTSATSAT